MSVTEFKLEGVPVETAEPSLSPSGRPSASPTTGEPTLSPTTECKGEITWGDPHFRVTAAKNSVRSFNYQRLGWFYYIAPCNLTQFKNWPFFFLTHHTRCYWRGNPKGCINNNKLILNTKPNPWIIEFNHQSLEVWLI